MSRIYAIREDNGGRILVAIECERCDAQIKPGPDIAESGWVKRGVRALDGTIDEYDYCPEHAQFGEV